MDISPTQTAAEYDVGAEGYRRAAERPMARIRFATLRAALLGMRGQLPERARIWDLGCGSGASSELLRELFPQARIVAVDISPVEIDMARQRAEQAGLAIDYRVGDLFTHDYPGDEVDLFVSVMALHYGDGEQINRLLQRLAKALGRQGRLVAQIANPRLPLPYRDYGIEHRPPAGQAPPWAEGMPYQVRLFAEPLRAQQPNWPAPLVEFTNRVHAPETYPQALRAAGMISRDQPLLIPDEVRAAHAGIDWSDLEAKPVYATFVAEPG